MKTYITLLLFILPLFAEAYDFVIDNFDVEIVIKSNGEFQVTETIAVTFNEDRRGIFRTLPFRYAIGGKDYQIKILNLTANETYKVSTEGINKKIRIGQVDKYINGAKEYVISYTIKNALISYDDTYEFFWNLTGNDWKVPIESVKFQIEIPERAAITQDNIIVYTGQYGERNTRAFAELEDEIITGQSTGALSPGSGLSIGIQIPSGAFDLADGTITAQVVQPKKILKDQYYPIPLAIIGLFSLLFFTKRKTESFPLSQAIYYPPEGLSPTEVGTFHDYEVNSRDLLALLPKWGNEGLIKVKNMMDGELLFSKLHPIDPSAPLYETTLFNGLFKNRDQVTLSALHNQLYIYFIKSLREIKKATFIPGVYDENFKSTFQNPLLFVLFLFFIPAGILLLIKFNFVISGFAFILSGILGIVMTRMQPKFSEQGQIIHNELISYRSFLENPDPSIMSELIQDDPDYLNKTLPYVVAFGLDDQWAKTMTNYESSAPVWFVNDGSSGAPSFSNFSQSFNVKEIQSAFSSAPANSASGGSGSSGGSGGGFGGGGGGSW